jgi:hypothetical protein
MEKYENEFLNFTEASKEIRYSPSWLRQHYRDEDIPFYQISARKILFKKSDLLEWLYSKRVGCAQERSFK